MSTPAQEIAARLQAQAQRGRDRGQGQAQPTDDPPAEPEPTLSEDVQAMESHAEPEGGFKDRGMFAGLKLRTATDILQHRGMFICITGKPGAGKTTLAPTIRNSRLVGAHVGKRILLADADSGAHVLDDFPDVDIIECKEADHVDRISQQLIRNPGDYNGAIFDNGTEILDLYQKKHKGKGGWEYWNAVYDDYLAIIRGMRNLARNRQFFCVFILWDTAESDEARKRMWREINLTPKLREKFEGIIDILGYVEKAPKGIGPYPPVLRFDYDPDIPTKKRINPRQQALAAIPDVIYQPDLGHIIDTVVGGDPWPSDLHKRVMPKEGGK